jgi:predicted nucleic acid-binding protein
VKLVIEEPESAALEQHLKADVVLATSRLAVVEVLRAVRLANPAPAVEHEVEQLLTSCMLVAVTGDVLREAAGLASATVRSLDAIHLASALRVEPDEMVVYDGRLAKAASKRGLAVSAPR